MIDKFYLTIRIFSKEEYLQEKENLKKITVSLSFFIEITKFKAKMVKFKVLVPIQRKKEESAISLF